MTTVDDHEVIPTAIRTEQSKPTTNAGMIRLPDDLVGRENYVYDAETDMWVTPDRNTQFSRHWTPSHKRKRRGGQAPVPSQTHVNAGELMITPTPPKNQPTIEAALIALGWPDLAARLARRGGAA